MFAALPGSKRIFVQHGERLEPQDRGRGISRGAGARDAGVNVRAFGRDRVYTRSEPIEEA